MGANAQTSVTLFVANAILTAQQQNFSAATGVPVFSTTVTRDAAFGGSNKVLAEGQLCYLESTDVVQYYTGAAWATVGPAGSSGLVRIGGGALSSTTTTFSNVFSATFRDYLIIADGVTTAIGTTIRMTIGSATAAYSYGFNRVTFAGAVAGTGASAQTDGWVFFDSPGTSASGGQMIMYSPFLAVNTSATFQAASNASTPVMMSGGAILADTTSHTGFTLASGSTMAGNISIYGLAIS